MTPTRRRPPAAATPTQTSRRRPPTVPDPQRPAPRPGDGSRSGLRLTAAFLADTAPRTAGAAQNETIKPGGDRVQLVCSTCCRRAVEANPAATFFVAVVWKGGCSATARTANNGSTRLAPSLPRLRSRRPHWSTLLPNLRRRDPLEEGGGTEPRAADAAAAHQMGSRTAELLRRSNGGAAAADAGRY